MTTPRLAVSLPLVVALVAASCGESGAASVSEPADAVVAPSSTTTTIAPAATAFAEPTTEDVRFQSDGFDLAGSLVFPAGEGPFPAVVVVSGSGPQTRASTPGYGTIRQKFGDAGFAVFSWDKPGSGASTGEFAEGEGLRQRAVILADGIEVLVEHPAIDGSRIGLWGISQAGWVMPLALDLTDDVAFMIVVSGGGEDSIEQLGYQIAQQLVCRGLSPEQGALAERYGPQAAKGETYDLYVEAMEVLLAIPGMEQYIGADMSSEQDWQPWPPHIDAYFDPMDVISRTTIPVLAVFGELDKNIDPDQGAEAYGQALQDAGNQDFHVEKIPGVGHLLGQQTTGCIGEPSGVTSPRYLELLDEWIVKLSG